MRDRIPTKVLQNGALRYAEYHENGEFVQHRYMLLDDEPTDEGTPLNKSTFLTDSTETAIWGDAQNRTVDEALKAVNYQIGDTLTTARTDLGDNWLLCNGAQVSLDNYPGVNMLPDAMLYGAWEQYNVISNYVITPIKLLNGYYVYTSGASVYYTTDLTGTWNKTGQINSIPHDIFGIVYGNGYWVICSGEYIKYATSLDGTWKSKQVAASNDYLYDIIFCNGYFVVVGMDGSCFYAADPTGDWTKTGLIASSCDCISISYGNGYWVIFANSSSASRIYYTTDITMPDSFPYVTVNISSTPGTDSLLTFANGEFAIACYGQIVHFSTPENIIVSNAANTEKKYIAYGKGYWIDTYGNWVEQLNEEWTQNQNVIHGGSDRGPKISFIDDKFVIAGDAEPRLQISPTNKIVLPTVTIANGLYTYIKAK